MYPIGSERLYNGYLEIKVSRSEWRWKHYLIWEAAHGELPKGHMLSFADGDNRNFSLDNLIAVSRDKFLYEKLKRAKEAKYPVGSEKIASNGYIMVKIAQPQSWRLKHHLIWEAAYGPIPDRKNIHFQDGDNRNFSLDNLSTQTPIQSAPIGAEQISHGYIIIKVAEPNSWRLKHHLVWEAAHGEIPEGYRVWFVDDDNRNFHLDNLLLISPQESGYLLSENMLHLKGDRLKSAVILARLGLAANEKHRKFDCRDFESSKRIKHRPAGKLAP